MKVLEIWIPLFLGFACTALGLAMMLQSGLGMGPWGAFEVAVSKVTGLSVGHVIQIVSLGLVLMSWTLRITPTLVTFLNVVFIGLLMDWFVLIVPSAQGVAARWCMFLLGLVVYGFGVSEYLRINRGSGPRESLMLGLAGAFGISIRVARIAIDVTVLVLAMLLGGPIGVGTVLFAISAGPLIQVCLDRMGFSARPPRYSHYRGGPPRDISKGGG